MAFGPFNKKSPHHANFRTQSIRLPHSIVADTTLFVNVSLIPQRGHFSFFQQGMTKEVSSTRNQYTETINQNIAYLGSAIGNEILMQFIRCSVGHREDSAQEQHSLDGFLGKNDPKKPHRQKQKNGIFDNVRALAL